MRARHRLPKIWLFTDERQGHALWVALERLPRGSGVVFRHYRAVDRATLASRVRAVCRRRGLLFVVAGPPKLARAWRADGAHGRYPGALTAPAHDRGELVAAKRARAVLVFVSPVHATASHIDARPLGPLGFGRLIRGAGIDVAALGGMTAVRWRHLARLGAKGWGAIDAWSGSRPGLGTGRDRPGHRRPSAWGRGHPSVDVRTGA